MRRTIRTLLALALVGGLLPAAPGARAADKPFKVRDGAGFFSPEAVEKADAAVAALYRKHKEDLLIETFKELPADRKAEGKPTEAVFQKWARDRYRDEDVRGVSVLICRHPGEVFVEVGDKTRERAFTASDRHELVRGLLERFKEKKFDEALLFATDFVTRQVEAHPSAAGPAERAPSGTGETPRHGGTGTSASAGSNWGAGIMGLLCVGLVVMLGLWVVFALFRAMTAPRYPVDRPPGYAGGGGYGGGGGPGYAAGGGYGGGGGGGGGFFSTFLGSMVGSTAGNWIYDSMFRGSGGGAMGGGMGGGHATGYNEPAAAAPYSPSSDASDRDSSGEGGSFDSGDAAPGPSGGSFDGGDASGGSFDDNTGGGDFGGGGDVGGGDFGGGGGDFGGGGGGDAGGDF